MENKSNFTDIKIANRVVDELRAQVLRKAEIIQLLAQELYITQSKNIHHTEVISELRNKVLELSDPGF